MSASDCPPALLGQVRADNDRAQTGWLGSKGRVGKDRPPATPLSYVTKLRAVAPVANGPLDGIWKSSQILKGKACQSSFLMKNIDRTAGPSQTQPQLLLCWLRSQAGHVARLPQGSDLHSSATTGSRPAGFRPGLWVSQVPIWGIQ